MSNKIVYIAGYSRSGSTILDIILGSHKNIVGTGELSYLFDDWLRDERLCTCGKPYKACDFWKNFRLPEEITFEKAIEIIRHVESRSSLPLLTQNKIPKDVIKNYNLIQTTLYDYIFKTANKNIIVDSSKTSRDMAGRFYALYKHTNYDVYVIHLVKNGLSVVESYVKKGRNWALEGHGKNDRFTAARSSLGWRLANKIALELSAKMPKERYVQIKYETFIDQPEKVLQEIGNFLNVDLSEEMATIKEGSFHPQHNVGGNRLRLEKTIRLQKPKKGKKLNLSFLHRFIFKIIAGKLQKRFGYSVSAKAALS